MGTTTWQGKVSSAHSGREALRIPSAGIKSLDSLWMTIEAEQRPIWAWFSGLGLPARSCGRFRVERRLGKAGAVAMLRIIHERLVAAHGVCCRTLDCLRNVSLIGSQAIGERAALVRSGVEVRNAARVPGLSA